MIGIVILGWSVGFQVRSALGVAPWDVLNQGVARHTGLKLGDVVIVTSVLVMLVWIPLRQRPGPGTLINVLLLGVVVTWSLSVLPVPHPLALRGCFVLIGIAGSAVGTALYVGAGLGPGPRDGLMTGLAARGLSLRLVRTIIEAVVLLVGWLLGGTVGVGTLLYAFGIGPAVHLLLPFLSPSPRAADFATRSAT